MKIHAAAALGAALALSGCSAFSDSATSADGVEVAAALYPLQYVAERVAGDRATVGPLVVPGRTACTACLHAHRADHDPDWPMLAAQLLSRPAPPTDVGVLLEAAVLAGRMLRETRDDAAVSVSLGAGSVRRTWRAHRPHARCLCRSPEGSATADALDSRSSEPTRSKASGPRA